MTDYQEKIRAKIGARLRAARQARGLKPAELAQHAGMNLRRIVQCEASGDLTCDELESLAAALRLPISHFVKSCRLCASE